MKPPIDLRFRPSLLLFLDETGEHICEQLRSVTHFTGFDPLLHQSVALLLVDSQNQRARRVSLQEKGEHEEDSSQSTDPLEALIERSLRDIQNDQRIQSITAAGYPVPNTRTQIFLVGDAHSSALPAVLEIVRQRLRKIGFSTLVCYFVNAYQVRQITGSLGDDADLLTLDPYTPFDEDGANWSERLSPDFCYVYEDMRTKPTESFFGQAVSHYTTAEALFALIATGITTEPFFVDLMQGHTPLHRYHNVGSMSTCLIGFPREPLLKYCSAKLGVALMEQWRADLLSQNTPLGELAKLQKFAVNRIQVLRRAIVDRSERPYANNPEAQTRSRERFFKVEVLRCPSLELPPADKDMRDSERGSDRANLAGPRTRPLDNQKMLRALQEASENLFLLFWPDDIDEEVQRLRLRPDDWTRLILQRGNRAVARYGEWDGRATQAWGVVADRFIAEIRRSIDYLWSKDQNGFEMATAYVEELDEQLAKLANDQSRWREEHYERYQSFLTAWTTLSEGPWVIPEDEGGSGAGQARPTMGNQHGAGAATQPSTPGANQTTLVGGANAQPRTANEHLPEREERIARRLEQRINWLQARIPSWLAQGVIAGPFLLALILALLPWTLRGWPALSLSPLATTLGAALLITLLTAAAHLAFHARYTRQVKEAREDLLIFYRRYYAFRCAQREDRLRVQRLWSPLRISVQTVRERLNQIQTFIEQTREDLEEQTRQIHRELFDESPTGQRDIFIANGERLQREGKNTLESFAGQISQKRVKEPVEDWHQSSADMKRQLIRQFRQQAQSLMEMSDEDAQAQIQRFVTAITRAYFKGPLVDLQYALDKENIWREARDRVETPLYKIDIGKTTREFFFVCGRAWDVNTGLRYLPDDARYVRTGDSHEWILLAAFFQGNLPATINPDLLFPEKEHLNPLDRGSNHHTTDDMLAADLDDELPSW